MVSILVFAVTYGIAQAARADLIVDQPPDPGGGPDSDTAYYYYSPNPSWQLLADDIRLTSDATVRRLVWWGLYGSIFSGSPQPPTGPETMRIRFYHARAGDGLPGLVMYEEAFANASRTATGRYIYEEWPHPEQRYQVDLGTPVVLLANTSYWLEIVQVGDVDSTFRWEVAVSPTDAQFAFLNPGVPDWQLSPPIYANLSLQLQSIPEPASALFLGVGGVVLSFRQRGRVRRWRG